MQTKGVPGEYLHYVSTERDLLFNGDKCIRYRHPRNVCKCHLPLREKGQDEAAVSSNITSSKTWSINGKTFLRPKTEGKGLMLSAFQSATIGFGDKLTIQQLKEVNDYRASCVPPRPPLRESPEIVHFEFGKTGEV